MKQRIIKVALADDHPGIRQAMAQMLNQQKNIEVIAEAANGQELLSIFSNLSSLPDIVMLDISMKVMDGYLTALEIRKNYPEIKTIAFSNYSDDYNIIRMLKNGVVAYLVKSVTSFDEICKALHCVMLDGYYSANIGEDFFSKAKTEIIPELTVREAQFLSLCCEGLPNKTIAAKMFLSPRTVDHYYDSLSKKLGVDSRIKLVALALRRGIVSPG